mmetsp:Transcript_18042/g.58276  ORF Transcript_18042/g.58276 Transcript_18042/m.58276 type:complete len:761 (-) Transcript_18042:29-2311(-)
MAPSWLLRQLFLCEGDEVRVRVVSLPLCALVVLQPHSQDFYEAVGDNAMLALQEALAPLPALTVGLSIPIELPGEYGVVRQVPVFIARLEDENGVEVLAAKMPAHGGQLGIHEVRVDFLPAADVAETGGEYKARVLRQQQEDGELEQLASAHRGRWRDTLKEAAASAALAPPGPEERRRLGDGTEGHELCFRFPNGHQLRRRFLPELTAADLKMFLRTLVGDAAAPWQPSPRTDSEGLTLAMAFPRRSLADGETVSQIGNRSVILVSELQGEVTKDDDAAADEAGAAAVLYPKSLWAEVRGATGVQALEREATVARAARRSVPFQAMLTGLGSALSASAATSSRRPTSGGSDPGGCLVGISDDELRALALSVGVPGADVARALDDVELRVLIAEHQVPRRGAPPPSSSSRGAGARQRPSLSSSSSSAPPAREHRAASASASVAAAPASGGGRCPFTTAQLAPLGLSREQFLDLPPDTRMAIAAAVQADSGSAAARPSPRSSAQRSSSANALPSGSGANAVRSRIAAASSSAREVSPASRAGGLSSFAREMNAVPDATVEVASQRRALSERGVARAPPTHTVAAPVPRDRVSAVGRPPVVPQRSVSAQNIRVGATSSVDEPGVDAKRPPATRSRAGETPLRAAGQLVVGEDLSPVSSASSGLGPLAVRRRPSDGIPVKSSSGQRQAAPAALPAFASEGALAASAVGVGAAATGGGGRGAGGAAGGVAASSGAGTGGKGAGPSHKRPPMPDQRRSQRAPGDQ